MSLYKEFEMIDSHMHIRGTDFAGIKQTLQGMEMTKIRLGMDAINVAAIPQWDPDSVGQNLLCILFKALYPNNYAFGGLDYYYPGLLKNENSYLTQVMNLMEMGFDGIKSIEAKPTARKMIDIPLDSPLYNKYYEYIESNDLPILWHVGDPADNWIENKCSGSIKQAGWCYSDGSFVSLEELYSEVDNVLKRFPRLKAIFAHFYFLSDDLERASAFLDRHESVYLDITPGFEMFYNFSDRRSDWRDFFIHYQDRIIFGTDNGWGDDLSPAQKVINAYNNVAFIRAFYETDDVIELGNIKVRGFSLPWEVCQKIYKTNYMKILKLSPPKPVNLKAAIAYGERLYKALKTVDTNITIIKQVEDALTMLKRI